MSKHQVFSFFDEFACNFVNQSEKKKEEKVVFTTNVPCPKCGKKLSTVNTPGFHYICKCCFKLYSSNVKKPFPVILSEICQDTKNYVKMISKEEAVDLVNKMLNHYCDVQHWPNGKTVITVTKTFLHYGRAIFRPYIILEDLPAEMVKMTLSNSPNYVIKRVAQWEEFKEKGEKI